VLHRPVNQELAQFLAADAAGRCLVPPQVAGHQLQMISPGLAAPPIAGKGTGVHLQSLGQPVYGRTRSPGHLVRDEPEPRQRAQLDRQAQAVRRTTAATWIDESHIGRREGEKPDQLVTVDIRERTQLLHVSIREQPGRHQPPPPLPQTVRR